MEEPPKAIEPIYPEICDVAEEISYVFETSLNYEARELSRILKKSHVKALLETHDAVVEVRKAPPASVASLSIPSSSVSSESSYKSTMPSSERTETVRVVGLRRQPKEPLVVLKKII